MIEHSGDASTRVGYGLCRRVHSDRGTRWRLRAGLIIGPLFLGVWAIQAVTREGYDPGYHPMSLLSLGSGGWVQVLNFVAAGVLFVVFGGGLARLWQTGPGRVWLARLFAATGAGLVLAGVFVTDPGAGFPPGAPTGAPTVLSWHGILHEVGFLVASVAWFAASVVLVLRWRRERARRWATLGWLVPLAVLALSAWPDLSTLGPRLVAGTAIQFGYTAAIAACALRELKSRSSTARFVDA